MACPPPSSRLLLYRPGPVRGLQNNGNTCFFNSTVQSLVSLPSFLRAFGCATCKPGEGPVTAALRQAVLAMIGGVPLPELPAGSDAGSAAATDAPAFNPEALFEALVAKAPRFKGHRQQDAQELLRFLLDRVEDEEKARLKKIALPATPAWSKAGPALPSAPAIPALDPITAIFGGRIVSLVCCSGCGAVSAATDPCYDLSLPLPKALVESQAAYWSSASSAPHYAKFGGKHGGSGGDKKKKGLGSLSSKPVVAFISSKAVTALQKSNEAAASSSSASKSKTFSGSNPMAGTAAASIASTSSKKPATAASAEKEKEASEAEIKALARSLGITPAELKKMREEKKKKAEAARAAAAAAAAAQEAAVETEPASNCAAAAETITASKEGEEKEKQEEDQAQGQGRARGLGEEPGHQPPAHPDPRPRTIDTPVEEVSSSAPSSSPGPVAAPVNAAPADALTEHEDQGVRSEHEEDRTSKVAPNAADASSSSPSDIPASSSALAVDALPDQVEKATAAASSAAAAAAAASSLGDEEKKAKDADEDEEGEKKRKAAAEECERFLFTAKTKEALCEWLLVNASTQQLSKLNMKRTMTPKEASKRGVDLRGLQSAVRQQWGKEPPPQVQTEAPQQSQQPSAPVSSAEQAALSDAAAATVPVTATSAAVLASAVSRSTADADAVAEVVQTLSKGGNSLAGFVVPPHHAPHDDASSSSSSLLACLYLFSSVETLRVSSGDGYACERCNLKHRSASASASDNDNDDKKEAGEAEKAASDAAGEQKEPAEDGAEKTSKNNEKAAVAEEQPLENAQDDKQGSADSASAAGGEPLVPKAPASTSATTNSGGATTSSSRSGSQRILLDAAKRILLLQPLPCVLVLHLKRFGASAKGHMQKLGGHVAFPETLDCAPFTASASSTASSASSSTMYRLCGVVVHSGGLGGGHYIAYCRAGLPHSSPALALSATSGGRTSTSSSSSGGGHSVAVFGDEWFCVSDRSVTKATLAEVLACEAYLLFYERDDNYAVRDSNESHSNGVAK